MRKRKMRSLREEIVRRAHFIEGQGDGIYMVLIRMDEIISAVRAYRRRKAATPNSPLSR